MAYPDCLEPTWGSNVRKTPDEEGGKDASSLAGVSLQQPTARSMPIGGTIGEQ